MTHQKSIFIHSLFNFLKRDKYILLKWLEEDLSELPKRADLDILIEPISKEKL